MVTPADPRVNINLLPGTPGPPAWSQGPPGPPGPIGPVGPAGPPGPAGSQGIQGFTGPPGPGWHLATQDPPPGSSGLPLGTLWLNEWSQDFWQLTSISPTDTWVLQGNLGGPPGPAGPQGPTGNPGPPGQVGPAGPQGSAGPAGDPGPQGVQGPVGPVGPQGVAGSTGPQGATGAQGPPGSQGIQGPAGPTGPAGADSTVPGPVGPQGPTGNTGAQGPAGATGAQGPAGPGVAAGGSAGQMLVKVTGTNYDTTWATPFGQTQADARYLQLSGGAVSGPITLPGNPTLALQAAPKQYVDSFVSPLGGALSGSLPNPSLAAGAAAANVGSLGGALSGTLPNPSLAAGSAFGVLGSYLNINGFTVPSANTWTETSVQLTCACSGKILQLSLSCNVFSPTAGCPMYVGVGIDGTLILSSVAACTISAANQVQNLSCTVYWTPAAGSHRISLFLYAGYSGSGFFNGAQTSFYVMEQRA